MNKDARIFVAGHAGLAGSAIVRELKAQGYSNLLLRSRKELDLRSQVAVDRFFAAEAPEYVILAAAKVGGIYANEHYPADFIRDNLQIELAIIDASWRHRVTKLLFLGSSCIYPKFAEQPISEDSLLTGSLEPTNEWYAIAKIAGIKLCQAYRKQYRFNAICLMPTNLYGPGDNFDPKGSHVLPALIRRFHEAHLDNTPQVTVWGTGTPRREFLHVDDLAAAVVFTMQHYHGDRILNVGTGTDVSIAELARLVAGSVGYKGQIVFDSSKPDGTPRKLLNVDRLHALGWGHKIELAAGIPQTYKWFVDNLKTARLANATEQGRDNHALKA